MKQEILDKLARLYYQDENDVIKKLKFKITISNPNRSKAFRITHDYHELKYHKERLAFYKRRLPMKPAKIEDALWDIDVCPCCRSVARLYKNYCEECGQRLMWE